MLCARLVQNLCACGTTGVKINSLVTSSTLVNKSNNMENLFNLAANHLEIIISNSSKAIKDDDLLFLYARYKQATVGPCQTVKPFFLDAAARKKWSSWKKLKTMSAVQAMTEYVDKIKHIDNSWDPNAITPRSGLGVSVSVMDDCQNDNISDEKKDIFDWCKEGSLAQITSLVSTSFPKDNENRTLLHWACDRGHLNIVKYLIQQGHDVNCKDSDLSTPLHYAASCDHYDIAAYLLQHNADASILDSDGETPFVCAVSEKTKLLIKDFNNK